MATFLPGLTCTFAKGSDRTVDARVVSVNVSGAVVESVLELDKNEYVDVSLTMPDGSEQALFGHVLTTDDDGIKLRWLHFEPGEEQRLAELFQEQDVPGAQDASEAHVEVKGTRRIIRPRKQHDGEADDDAPGSVEGESETSKKSTRKSSRRVVLPKNKKPAAEDPAAAEDDDLAPSDIADDASKTTLKKADAGEGGEPEQTEDSGAHNVVITTTQKFEQLPADAETGKTEKPAEQKKRSDTDDGGDNKTRRMTKRHTIVSTDGRLDVGATIRSRAKTVSASQLAERHQRVRVLNMSTIKALIQDAVGEAAERLGANIEESERKKLLEEAEEEFQEKLKAFQAEKKGAVAQVQQLQQQLERAESMLEEEKHRAISADQFTMSDAGMEEMESRFSRLIHQAVRQGGAGGAVEDELQKMVSNLLDREREKIAEKERDAQGEAIRLLERKVSRLANTLEETESERDLARRQMQALEASGGGALRNVIDIGLKDDDPGKEAKLALLKDIFNENKELRDHLKKEGREIPSPARPAAPKPDTADQEAAKAMAAGGAASDQAKKDERDEEAPDKEAPDKEAAAQEEEAAEPMVAESGDDVLDPDDMPWEGPPEKAEDDEHMAPVKKITGFKEFQPPPLQRQDDDETDQSDNKAAKSAVESAEPAAAEDEDAPSSDSDGGSDPDDESWEPPAEGDEIMDPDDMPWDGPPESSDDDEHMAPVKKISGFKNFEPPPLKRKD